MKNNKLSIRFIIQKTRINKQGKCPIRGRISQDKQRKEFSTGLFVSPKFWDNKNQKVKPPDKNHTYINTQLRLISQKINEAFLFAQVNYQDFSVHDVMSLFNGERKEKKKTIVMVFKEHNLKVEKLIGKEYVKPTLWKYRQALALLQDFLRYKYKKSDYQFDDLNVSFLKEYEFFLRTEKNLAQSSTYKAIQRFKRIIKIAISEGFLDRDPFLLYKVKRPRTKVVYLNDEELTKLEKSTFTQSRLQHVKDMFIFCCYTGLAYKEMSVLGKKNITSGFDGNKWIKMRRKKTDTIVSIPLLPKAEVILEKYSFELPVISNQKFNSFLKEIADIVGLEKRLTHHIARKTFASTVLLNNGVPIEIVSELLGHSKISTTQEHYAKIVLKNVSNEINALKKKLEGK